MDKYDLVLDIIEHPEKYTAGQLREIMADDETKEIYTLLCKTESAVQSQTTFDAETGWKDFTAGYGYSFRRQSWWQGNRAASIAAIIGTSVVAVAAGIALTVTLTRPRQTGQVPETEISAIKTSATAKDTVAANPTDIIAILTEPTMFENVSLEDILKKVEAVYHVKAVFKNKEAASLHLYYKFDPALPLAEVVEQLNTFEQIDINLNDSTLTIY